MSSLKEVLDELSCSRASYKFSAEDGKVRIAVDGLMHSLRSPAFS